VGEWWDLNRLDQSRRDFERTSDDAADIEPSVAS
jgi:hypothetical protein